MVYFLGRDVSVVITTESAVAAESIGISGNKCVSGDTAADAGTKFAEPMDTAAFASNTAVGDLTGVDISIGATDEDITYIGQKATGKVEQKKEISVTLTRKKNNNLWDIIFNGPTNGTFLQSFSGTQYWGARWGLAGSGVGSSTLLGDGQVNPKDVTGAVTTDTNYGYRIHLMMKSGSELISVPNCTITGYTTSLSADGVTEETMEFATQQTILPSANGTDIDVTETLVADF
tara:strand:- start:11736 stop:12431 length:696 start_codon:yes stop_codon:yes gene_type:complete